MNIQLLQFEVRRFRGAGCNWVLPPIHVLIVANFHESFFRLVTECAYLCTSRHIRNLYISREQITHDTIMYNLLTFASLALAVDCSNRMKMMKAHASTKVVDADAGEVAGILGPNMGIFKRHHDEDHEVATTTAAADATATTMADMSGMSGMSGMGNMSGMSGMGDMSGMSGSTSGSGSASAAPSSAGQTSAAGSARGSGSDGSSGSQAASGGSAASSTPNQGAVGSMAGGSIVGGMLVALLL